MSEIDFHLYMSDLLRQPTYHHTASGFRTRTHAFAHALIGMVRDAEHAQAVAILKGVAWWSRAPDGKPCWCASLNQIIDSELPNPHSDACLTARAYCEEKS